MNEIVRRIRIEDDPRIPHKYDAALFQNAGFKIESFEASITRSQNDCAQKSGQLRGKSGIGFGRLVSEGDLDIFVLPGDSRCCKQV